MENCESNVSQFRLDDLQLVAELEKTLLERNMELEKQMKAYRSKADEQEREIVHLRRFISAMVEDNDSRLKVYEKLDAMLEELERVNQRLNVEKSRDKEHIKLLATNLEGLEARCEGLTQQLSIARQSLDRVDRYRQERHTNSPNHMTRHQEMVFPEIQSIVLARHENQALCHSNLALSLAEDNSLKTEDSEDLIRMLGEMETIMRDYLTERRRCAELEEQLQALIQQNQCLQARLADINTQQNMMSMSMQEELCLLDEVRQGRMCSRCLGDISKGNHTATKATQGSVATLNMTPMEFWKAETDKKGTDTVSHLRNKPAGVVSLTITEHVSSSLNTKAILKPMKLMEENGHVLEPLEPKPLEHIPIAVGMQKKNRRKHRHHNNDTVTWNSPQYFREQQHRQLGHDSLPENQDVAPPPLSDNWNGAGMIVYNQNMETPRTSQSFIKDDLSYAEVLRGVYSPGDYIPSIFHSSVSQ